MRGWRLRGAEGGFEEGLHERVLAAGKRFRQPRLAVANRLGGTGQEDVLEQLTTVAGLPSRGVFKELD